SPLPRLLDRCTTSNGSNSRHIGTEDKNAPSKAPPRRNHATTPAATATLEPAASFTAVAAFTTGEFCSSVPCLSSALNNVLRLESEGAASDVFCSTGAMRDEQPPPFSSQFCDDFRGEVGASEANGSMDARRSGSKPCEGAIGDGNPPGGETPGTPSGPTPGLPGWLGDAGNVGEPTGPGFEGGFGSGTGVGFGF